MVKQALEWLFYTGQVTAADRTTSFARRYDLPERVLPRGRARRADPGARGRVPGAGRARPRGRSGVAAEPELRDYFRLPVDGFKRAVAELVEDKVLRAGRGAGLAARRPICTTRPGCRAGCARPPWSARSTR